MVNHLSRPVRVIVQHPEATWLGLDQEQFKLRQQEEPIWKELAGYLKGDRILDEMYFVREKSDGSLHCSLIVPQSLTVQALRTTCP